MEGVQYLRVLCLLCLVFVCRIPRNPLLAAMQKRARRAPAAEPDLGHPSKPSSIHIDAVQNRAETVHENEQRRPAILCIGRQVVVPGHVGVHPRPEDYTRQNHQPPFFTSKRSGYADRYPHTSSSGNATPLPLRNVVMSVRCAMP